MIFLRLKPILENLLGREKAAGGQELSLVLPGALNLLDR